MNQETKMLGCTSQVLDDSLTTAYNINIRLAGMLSDVQECISSGDKQRANILLNQVKYYFFEYTDTRNETPDLVKATATPKQENEDGVSDTEYFSTYDYECNPD